MNPDRPWGSMLSPEHYEAARRIGEEGIVLLQNKGNVLPIDLDQTKKDSGSGRKCYQDDDCRWWQFFAEGAA